MKTTDYLYNIMTFKDEMLMNLNASKGSKKKITQKIKNQNQKNQIKSEKLCLYYILYMYMERKKYRWKTCSPTYIYIYIKYRTR